MSKDMFRDMSRLFDYRFALEGLTCSACIATVETAVQQALLDDDTTSSVVQVRISLFPDPSLSLLGAPEGLQDLLIEAIEDVGFGVILVSVEPATTIERSAETTIGASETGVTIGTWRWALEGLTCSACVATVTNAVEGIHSDDFSISNIQVALFPEPHLTLESELSQEDQKQTLREAVEEAIENVGFDSKFVSVVEEEQHTQTATRDKTAASPRTILFSFSATKDELNDVQRVLEAMDAVQAVTSAIPSSKRKGRKTDVETGIVSSEAESTTTLRVTFQPTIDTGVRTLLRAVETVVTTPVQVQDASSYQKTQEAAEARRLAEIQKYHREFIFAAAFSIPIFVFAMVLMYIPATKHFIHFKPFGNVTVEEIVSWILATPVQFVSGARFYRESYYSLRTHHFGMGFLICIGTTAAYFYSVFAVLNNAIRQSENRLSIAFETSALLITFVLLGNYLEHRAKARTSQAIADLVGLAPQFATLVGVWKEQTESKSNQNVSKEKKEGKGGAAEEVPEETLPLVLLQLNDVLVVRPGEKVPTDGVVISGCTSIDESMLTGESVPTLKQAGENVIGGTINLNGTIQMRVASVGLDTTLSQIIRLVDSAQSSKAPVQAFADRVSGRFVPGVLVASVFTYVVWAILLNTSALEGVKDDWTYWDHGLNDATLPLIFAISVLVISCPCALGLATPTAIMVGSGVGARNGILIKGGGPLEAAKNTAVAVLDKTGTITVGAPSVEDVLLLSDRCSSMFETKATGKKLADTDSVTVNTEEDAAVVRLKTLENVFFLAASAEYGSEHPLAKGIIAKAEEFGIGDGLLRNLVRPEDFTSETGQGINCTVDGCHVHVGNRRSLDANSIDVSEDTYDAMEFLESKGQTAVVLSVNGLSEAVIGLIDKAKDEAALTVNVLQKAMGIDVYMLTGDNIRTARVVAAEIGLDPQHVIADVLPEGKVDCIKQLQERYEGSIAMIGDGVNDSPALAQADIGIAIGAGTNIAIETAGVVLINSKLTDVVAAIDLARTIYRRIRWNFVWALGYNTLAIPVAAGCLYGWAMSVVLPPYVAGLAMIMSSMTVLLSSLLLNRYQPPKFEKGYKLDEDGRVNLDRIRVISKDVGSMTVHCDCSVSGICSCPEQQCGCVGCPQHKKASKDEMQHVTAPGDDIKYPGCQSSWGKPCSCKGNCRCGDACKCGREPVVATSTPTSSACCS